MANVFATSQSVLRNRSLAKLGGSKNSINRLYDLKRITASYIIVPLQAGAMLLEHCPFRVKELVAYSQEELELLSSIADQVGYTECNGCWKRSSKNAEHSVDFERGWA